MWLHCWGQRVKNNFPIIDKYPIVIKKNTILSLKLWRSVTLGGWDRMKCSSNRHTHSDIIPSRLTHIWFFCNIITRPCGVRAPWGSPDLFWGQTVDYLYLLSFYSSQSTVPLHNWDTEIEIGAFLAEDNDTGNCEKHKGYFEIITKLLLPKWMHWILEVSIQSGSARWNIGFFHVLL